MKKLTFTILGGLVVMIEVIFLYYFGNLYLYYHDENEALSNFYQFWVLNMVVIMFISLKIFDVIYEKIFRKEEKKKKEEKKEGLHWLTNLLGNMLIFFLISGLILGLTGLYLEALLPPKLYHDILYSYPVTVFGIGYTIFIFILAIGQILMAILGSRDGIQKGERKAEVKWKEEDRDGCNYQRLKKKVDNMRSALKKSKE